MKICFFNCAKVWGGGEKWHFDMAQSFHQAGHEVCIVSNKNSELLARTKANGIKTKSYSITNLSFVNPLKICRIYRFFKKEKFDVLVMNFPKDLKIAAPVAKLLKIPKIVYRRGTAIPIKNTFLNRFLFRKCLTDVLANSEATKKSILQNNSHLFPADKIKVIYNGINIEKDRLQTTTQNETPVIGNLGRLVYQKGVDILLEVASILKKRNVNCHFKIGGSGVQMQTLTEYAAQLGVSDYIEFIGFVNDSYEFMNSIDIFALTSRGEGFGYVTAEAMRSAKPIVAFDTGATPELIFNNENGFLIPFEDKNAFADKLEELIKNQKIRQEMGVKGFEMLQEKFDFEKNKKMVLDYLYSTFS